MRRPLITWSLVAGVILGAFGLTVLMLNNTVYNASGFVMSYLDALARKDAAGALELIGGAPDEDGISHDLLRRAAMADLTDIRIIGDTANADGTHRVTATYEADGTPGRIAFLVEPTGTLFGLFTDWRFTTGPLSTLYVTVVGDARFTANGVDLVSPTPDDPAGYAVFAPGSYELVHRTTYLESTPNDVPIKESGASIPAAVVVTPNALMVETVQKDVNRILDTCATQEVLMPTGCPFGQSMGNRIISPPQWSITDYPEVSLREGERSGQWVVPQTAGTAHLVVDVRSLFDGSVSTFDEDIPFAVSYVVAFLPGDDLLITEGYD